VLICLPAIQPGYGTSPACLVAGLLRRGLTLPHARTHAHTQCDRRTTTA
jgi:hypothetical protein